MTAAHRFKLSPSQQSCLDRINRFGDFDRKHDIYIYMPYKADMKSFGALERKGLVIWCRVDDGFQYNGFRRA